MIDVLPDGKNLHSHLLHGRSKSPGVRFRKASPIFSAGPDSPIAWLAAGDVLGLQALRARPNLELNCLALVEALVTVHLDCGKMDEDVLTGLALDEPVTLAGV